MKKFNLKESSEETIKQAVRNFYSKKSKEDLLNEIFTILDMFLKDKGLSYDDLARGLKAQGHDIDVEDPVQAARKELPKLGVQLENLNEGKNKSSKKSYMMELAEIDSQSAIVAMEAKINKLEEMALAKEQRLNMVSEDENLSELISKSAVKEMQKEIKEIRKMQEKLKKVYEKKNGKKMPEMVDEDEEIKEMFPDKNKDGTYDISKVLDKAVHGDDVKRDPATGNPIKEDELEEGEEIEEGGYMPNYEEDSDGTMEEEVIKEEAPINDVVDFKTKKLVGTHQYGKGFKANEIGKKLGYKDEKTGIPNGTEMEEMNPLKRREKMNMRSMMEEDSVSEEVSRWKKLAGI